MPSELPIINVRFVDQDSFERVRKRAADTGVSMSAFLLLCAGEPYPERGGDRREEKEAPEVGKKKKK